jgi:hypothetical protein
MRTNIFAFTDQLAADISYPGYVSVNAEERKLIEITVRSPNAQMVGAIKIDLDQAEQLAVSMLTHILKARKLIKDAASTPKSVMITINHEDHPALSNTTISYERICELAHVDVRNNPSVVIAYPHDSEHRDRMLQHRRSAPVVEGMAINCMITGNA